MKKLSIVAVGLAGIDLILDVVDYPAEDHKTRAIEHTKSRGGNAANLLEVISQFDLVAQSYLISPLPTDTSDTRFILDNLQQCNINASAIAWRHDQKETPTSYIIRNQSTKSRTIISHRKSKRLTCDEFIISLALIQNQIDWCHFEGKAPLETLKMLKFMHEQHPSTIVSIELETSDTLDDERKLLLAQPDLVVFSQQWLQQHNFATAQFACDELIKQGYAPNKKAAWVFILGAAGCVGFEFCAQQNTSINALHIKAQPINNIVDTIGAGDTFLAGLILKLSQRSSLQSAMEFANNLAAKKIAQYGLLLPSI